VDNVDRLNYVLFEFSAPVVPNKAYLDAVLKDSDVTVYVGTASDPFNNHLSLDDAVLAGLVKETNTTSSTGARWADFNASQLAGNVLVIAAQVDDTSPEDWFKIRHLDVTCPGQAQCVPVTVAFSGNSYSDGSDGNIRTFSVNGLSVKASAFSRTRGGSWATAYLGLYGEGLGVTDSSEGSGSDGRHRVDNIDRNNYVLFEFSAPVVVNQVYLDSVVTDSDVSVWIGSPNNPYTNHVTLSDAVLEGFGAGESNTTGSGGARWADVNAGGKSGTTLVVAGWTGDTSPDDQFKIYKLDVCRR
jgi:hypothetical protein